MRIRTIKEGFWQSETLSSISKESRLLAVAILNYADDKGYFYDVPQVIRGALFPFDEDSSSIRRGLDELSSIGYIRRGTTQDGKRVAHIVNFLVHQRIDRPQPSKIAVLEIAWDEFDEHSTNIRRDLAVGMEEEGNGRGEGENNTPIVPSAKKQRDPFVPPSEERALAHCKEKHPDWHPSSVSELWRHYDATGWTDKDGNQIKNWKNKFSVIYGFKKPRGQLGPTESFLRNQREQENSNPDHRRYMQMKVERDYAE